MCEVGESSDMVHLHVALASADLAGIRQESRDEFLLWIVHPDRLTIGGFRRSLPLEGNPAEPCHQWLPVLPLNSGLEADSGPIGSWTLTPEFEHVYASRVRVVAVVWKASS